MTTQYISGLATDGHGTDSPTRSSDSLTTASTARTAEGADAWTAAVRRTDTSRTGRVATGSTDPSESPDYDVHE
ncbi:hypothetical protein [Salinibaculum marinum]|uniref:hypothetical protein n=1 Tax=Salinibaculum marinum TaxID=3131993 RepID=UPI0030D398A8